MPYTAIQGEQNIYELASELMDISNQELKDKDLHYSEQILLSQAQALQAIFMNLSRRALNIEHMENLEQYLCLTLKAQSQWTRTLEVLSVFRNCVSVAFVRQTNIGQAVQVKNGTPRPTPLTQEPTRA